MAQTNRLRIFCLNTLEGTSFVVQVEGTPTWVVVTENKRGYISCGSVQVEGTSTWLFKENKGGYIPCGSLLVKDFTRLKEISRTGDCLGTGCRHGLLPNQYKILIQRTNCLRILCLNTLEGTSFVVQVEGTPTWVVVTENKSGYISCGSVQVEGTSTWLFKENKGGYIPCGSFLVKDFTRLIEISRTGGCLGTGCSHGWTKINGQCGVNKPYVDCSDAFNTFQVFGTRDDVLQWARSVAHENGFVAVIMRSDAHTGSRGRSSFVLIGCERSGQYKCRKKEFVRRDTGSRKCGCPFKLCGKPVIGGEGWTVKLICGIHKNRLKDEFVVCDQFWCHPDAMKLCNACHLVFFIDNTYKTNRYRLPLLDFVGVTPTGMTFSAEFAYLKGERVNNVVWALERFRSLFLRRDRLPVVIVIDRYLALMNAVKTVFPKCTNLLCRFHIDKNVKAKCKSLIGQKNAWEYVMDNWGTLVDCPSEQQFTKCLQKFQMAFSPWPMVESAHWALKRVLHNSLADLCSVWDVMNNMIMLQNTQIKASFETSTCGWTCI
ncbi:PKS-NRPS hybrid synthetase [Glycine soja]